MKGLTDAELVGRYAAGSDEAAFAEIARRHGPMVYAVCRRRLGSAADDAVQAVFMLLARKARSLSRREALAGWLHGAANLVAREHLRAAGRRRRAEKEAAEMRQAERERTGPGWTAVRPEVDAAIEKLPRHYREAVLLSCVEGRPEAQVARELGVAIGTVKSRVSRGLEKLRERLAQRGKVLGVAGLAAMLAENGTEAMSAALASKVAGLGALGATAGAAAGASSASLLMMKGAVKAMFMFKVKVAAAVLGATLVAGTAVPVAGKLVNAGEPKKTAGPPKAGAVKPGKAAVPAKPGTIAWGKAAGGLQAGLVPMGGDAAKGWNGPQCPKCRKFNRMLVMNKCIKCGGQANSNRKVKFCRDCATARRVCQACGKAKPASAKFIAGQPLKLEFHLRNAGRAPLKTGGYALLHARWKPVWQIEASDGRRTFVSRPATPKEHPMVMPGMVAKAPDVRKAGWHYGTTVTFSPPSWRFMSKGKAPAATDPKHLPAGKYTLRVTFSSYGDLKDKTVWKGKITSAAVRIEVVGKGAAVGGKSAQIALAAARKAFGGRKLRMPDGKMVEPSITVEPYGKAATKRLAGFWPRSLFYHVKSSTPVVRTPRGGWGGTSLPGSVAVRDGKAEVLRVQSNERQNFFGRTVPIPQTAEKAETAARAFWALVSGSPADERALVTGDKSGWKVKLHVQTSPATVWISPPEAGKKGCHVRWQRLSPSLRRPPPPPPPGKQPGR